MKVAVVEFSDIVTRNISNTKEWIKTIEENIYKAAEKEAVLVALPGFTGCFYQWLQMNEPSLCQVISSLSHQQFVQAMMELSAKYKVLLCSGSYWERVGDDVFHTACLMYQGKILLKQRQIYLSRWERALSFKGGKEVYIRDINGWKVAIILATDVFYPQVARRAALLGADVVISPVGFVGEINPWVQVSGVWQTTQLNHYFALESAFNGRLGEKTLWGESIIHAPLPMTYKEQGILERSHGSKQLIVSRLDNEARRRATKEFNVLAQLNPDFYDEIQGLGGAKNG
ncbi:MAG: hypothetical protein PHP06_02720 [Clostridia bacterium]|nr:hypothetical protein [Clostridia bacterium]